MGLRDVTTRRAVGKAMLAGSALAAAGCAAWLSRLQDTSPDHDPLRGGKLLGTLPLEDEGNWPLDTLLGDELDGRRLTDLSHVDRGPVATPTGQFYVRTRASHLLDTSRPWSVRVGSPAGAARITLDELIAQAEPQGLHVMECAGNTRGVRFGMISVASWHGVPLSGLLDGPQLGKSAWVLISGFDEYAAKPRFPSVPGASWIFSRRDIEDSRAFLATGMNGQPLTPDHGAPVRLVVPGWYGCSCIKWVNEVGPANEADEPTSQMQEYAARTHQRGMPARVGEYQPVAIDPAAMPVRVEKWLVDGNTRFNVIGIVWGGSRPPDNLQISFGADEPYVPVGRVLRAVRSAWGLWSHVWTPRRSGTYRIGLRLADPSIRTRRLDMGYYTRQVRID
jgi:DMSO/TMAO reductase YedYZ molybdopterin-dependent catalytic subunit